MNDLDVSICRHITKKRRKRTLKSMFDVKRRVKKPDLKRSFLTF